MDNKRDIYTKYMVDNDREYRVDHNQERVDNDRDRVDITGIGWTMTGIYIGWTTTGIYRVDNNRDRVDHDRDIS